MPGRIALREDSYIGFDSGKAEWLSEFFMIKYLAGQNNAVEAISILEI